MRLGLPLTLGAAIGLTVVASCSSDPSGPTEGTFNVRLTTPNSDDGAVLFTVSGGPVDAVEALGYTVYSARIDANTLRVIVTGDLSSGPVVRIRIADQRQLSRYSGIVNQVAARASYLQRDPTSYSIAVEP
jgi:hypothetical protein